MKMESEPHLARSNQALRLLFLVLCVCLACSGARAQNPAPTVLGLKGTRFTLNGTPTFLLGISYYAALGAPEEFVRKDLDAVQANGFNWLRVWASWSSLDENCSAVDARGLRREPFLTRLKDLVSVCDRRGLVVDVTLTRGKPGPADFHAHEQAVEAIITTLKSHRNWYLDLANEHDIADGRHVSTAEIKQLREMARRLDPQLLVTASFGGHDLSKTDIEHGLITAGLDFVCPHRPRTPDSAMQTEAQTRACLALMGQLGREAPIQYQEPFRRGYTDWQPRATDFLADLRGALSGGAAGWCFHNGLQRGTPDHQPRRSFDLRARPLFEQLDAEERLLVAGAAAVVKANALTPGSGSSAAGPASWVVAWHAKDPVWRGVHLSVSRSKVYGLMDTGRLPHVKLGRSRRVRWEDVLRLVAFLEGRDA
jgi:excisionase family DNA binding protein